MASHHPIPWKLHSGARSYPDALAPSQIKDLAERYGFTEDQLLALSEKLALALKPELHISAPELVPHRKSRGRREAQTAIDDLLKAEKALAKAKQTVSELRFSNPFAHTGLPNPSKGHLDGFAAATASVSDFRNYLQIMQRNNYVIYSGIPDLRKVRDLRREIVCWVVFNFWDEADRSLTFTTDPITSERGGALFAFINAIVTCMTEPATVISGETLKLELQRWQEFPRKGPGKS